MKHSAWSLAALALIASGAQAKIIKSGDNGFLIEHRIVLPLAPEEAYDVMTGDISGWWDHTFSEEPVALYIEARPGGCFCEIFDNSGNGAQHAVVTYAERGKTLRMAGPLGLMGNAFTMSMTFTFEAHGDGTSITLRAAAWGAMEKGWDEAIDGVWQHFLHEALVPFVTSGRYKE